MESDSRLRVCYFGTYRENYSRNQMMIAGLRLNGVIVIECHETLWHGIEDRVRVVSGGWLNPIFWWRFILVYWRLIKTYFHVGDYDILIVGYPGQFDIFIARMLTWLKHKPLIWDVFMSIFLISVERGLDKQNRFSMNLLHLIEGMALKLPDLLILDTTEYVQWFNQNYGICPERFHLVPTGADDRIFYPRAHPPALDGKLIILYAGTFIPNHGVIYIVEAAKLLVNEPGILFEFIGKGPDLEKAQQYVLQNKQNNVKFTEWMEKDELVHQISQADICLGVFGTTPQSLMTVQNKIYEALAMEKAVISGDSPAVRQEFKHEEQIYLCERANGKSLAEAILVLCNDPSLREKIAQNGYKVYKERYGLVNNGERFKTHLLGLMR